MNDEYIYKSSDGTETPVSKMNNSHLVNALLKITDKLALTKITDEVSFNELTKAKEALKAEVFKRMPAPEVK